MNRILTYQPGEIRRLQDEALENRLADFVNTLDSYIYNYSEPERVAQKEYSDLINAAKAEASYRFSTTGYIVCATLSLCIVILCFLVHSVLLWIIGAVLALILWLNGSNFKTQEEKTILYNEALNRRDKEIKAAEKKLSEAKARLTRAQNSQEKQILDRFAFQEIRNYGLDGPYDIRQIHKIVSQGYARTFPQALQVYEQRKHNKEMQRIAEEQRQQELRHQKAMEQEAARQRYAQERYNQQQIDIARENERSTRRMADAQEELAWIAKKDQEDKYWSQW